MSNSLSQIDAKRASAELEGRPPQEILRWAVETFADRFAIQSSMQKTAGVLMHMISEINPATEIVFVDTGVHFPETLETRDEFIRRFGVNIRSYSPRKSFEEQRQHFGRDLYLFDGDKNPPGYQQCCELRKEIPYLEAVRERFDAVAGGLMRSEGGARSYIQIVNEEPRISGFKIYPLAQWNDEMVEDYTRRYDLPVHKLYAEGYASIGCRTCTTPIKPGEPKRAGRWRHIWEADPDLASSPLYCGINLEDLKKKKQG